LNVNSTTLSSLDPALIEQLKASLEEPLFEKLNGSLFID